MSPLDNLPGLLRSLRRKETEMVRLLGRFVRQESPTDSKDAVDAFGSLVAAEWRRKGAEVRLLRQTKSGNHVRAEWGGGDTSSGQILVLGHLDTVYPLGTLRSMPFRVSRGRAFGPGAFDMKGGLVIALCAIEALSLAGCKPARRIVFLWTSDEETGSKTSRALIEREARRSAAVLVLEPASGLDGRVKTQRKACGTAELLITGRTAHAGLDPGKGVNAIQEMALQLTRLTAFNRPRSGVSVNPTIAGGGTRSNVIPGSARLVLDLRAATTKDMHTLERKLHAIRPILPAAKVEVRGGFSRPPMEHSMSAGLLAHARRLARTMGWRLGEASAGGGSDGNFTAAIGIPTLDGLGAVGEGAHSEDESVIVRSLPERAALLAGLLATL